MRRDLVDDAAAVELARRRGRDKCVYVGCPVEIEPSRNHDGYCRFHREKRRQDERLRSAEAQRRTRARRYAAGLTAHGKPPTGRRMIDWRRGLHVVQRRADGRCDTCLRPTRPYPTVAEPVGYRHVAAR